MLIVAVSHADEAKHQTTRQHGSADRLTRGMTSLSLLPASSSLSPQKMPPTSELARTRDESQTIHHHDAHPLYLALRSCGVIVSWRAIVLLDARPRTISRMPYYLVVDMMTRWSSLFVFSASCFWSQLALGSTSSSMKRSLLLPAFASHPRKSHLFSSSSSSCNFHHRDKKNLWSVEECIEQRHNLKFIDGSWYHKGERNGRQEFEQGPRIPGAHYWDMDDIATSQELFPDLNPKGLRVMFPPKSLIAAALKAMNITTIQSYSSSKAAAADDNTINDDMIDPIIIYGRRGCFFTPRIWYLLKTFGHDRVGLLQGSLEDWMAAGGPVDDTPISYGIHAKDLVASTTHDDDDDKLERLVDMAQVLEQLNNNNVKFIDTRGSDNFAKGHLPGAISIPYRSLVQKDNPLVLKSRPELLAILQAAGIIDDSTNIWLSCGSGVSVCHMALALDECGYPPAMIYDGSWNEWGSDPDTPKEVSKMTNDEFSS